MGNMTLWDRLSVTDPAHTKPFKRSGGFSGTALKPIWVERMLTEVFGPCGTGWGTDEPKFQIVPAADEVLVYCTLRGWYYPDDKSEMRSEVWGVGGDKILAKTKNGLQSDDEALKKAYTDAMMNAFKHLGVGGDIHIGMFDDCKYVERIREEFSKPVPDPDGVERLLIMIEECHTELALKNLWTTNQSYVASSSEKDRLTAAKDARKEQLKLKKEAA